jgi:formylglycine-generating enzyme required for sulfatase activity
MKSHRQYRNLAPLVGRRYRISVLCLLLFGCFLFSAAEAFGQVEGGGGGTSGPPPARRTTPRKKKVVKKTPPRRAAVPTRPAVGPSRAPSGNAMQFVWVPPGVFEMGEEDSGFDNESPVHTVYIRRGFYLGKYEVTQGQWYRLMGTTLRQQRDLADPGYSLFGEGPNYPMVYVSWREANAYILRLNQANDGFIYSLPTEAEWEYAARAGTTTPTYGPLDSIAWYGNNSGNRYVDADAIFKRDNYDNKNIIANGNESHPVGLKRPNAFGLYDMLGNVWEFCQDVLNEDGYYGVPNDGSAYLSIGKADKRVWRGASWENGASNTRAAKRFGRDPGNRSTFAGFRVLARPR